MDEADTSKYSRRKKSEKNTRTDTYRTAGTVYTKAVTNEATITLQQSTEQSKARGDRKLGGQEVIIGSQKQSPASEGRQSRRGQLLTVATTLAPCRRGAPCAPCRVSRGHRQRSPSTGHTDTARHTGTVVAPSKQQEPTLHKRAGYKQAKLAP